VFRSDPEPGRQRAALGVRVATAPSSIGVISEQREREVWSDKTQRRVTWTVLIVVALLIAFLVLAWWRLRG
jgi:hypothetical protein